MHRKRVAIGLVGAAFLLLAAGIVLVLLLPNSADRASQSVSADPTAPLADVAQPTASQVSFTPTPVKATADVPKQTQPKAEATVVRTESPASEPNALATGTASRPTPTEPEPTPTLPTPTPTEVILGCCQCTAVGMDQDVPFRRPKGYTCAEFCFEGCLERGHGNLVCTLGRVSGYDRLCPTAPA